MKELHDQNVDEDTFVIVLDMDGPNAMLNVSGMLNLVRSCKLDWTGLFANQREAYYDIFALRHPVYCPTIAGERCATQQLSHSETGSRPQQYNVLFGHVSIAFRQKLSR